MKKDDGSNLSPILSVAYKLLTQATKQILEGECNEEEIAEVLVSLSPETRGYKKPDDYVTIDKGMKLLGMGQNRVGFCNLMKKHHIVNEKFNTVHIGYKKQKIIALKHKRDD